MKQTAVPFSLVISPFAKLEAGEMTPPIVDMGPIGPVRCGRCKAYMCPYMQFIDGGRRSVPFSFNRSYQFLDLSTNLMISLF